MEDVKAKRKSGEKNAQIYKQSSSLRIHSWENTSLLFQIQARGVTLKVLKRRTDESGVKRSSSTSLTQK